MVWQLVLPGTHSVTLVNAASTYGELFGGAAAAPCAVRRAATGAAAPDGRGQGSGQNETKISC
jgi:hypothetical protein